jgi:hypothetical protein
MQNGAISYDPATSTVSTAVFKAGSVSFDKVSLSKASDRGNDCLGVINHVLVSGNSQAQETPCISSINWHGGSGLTVQQSGSASHPTYTIVPEPGYYIPKLGGGRTSDTAGSSATNASTATVTVGANIAHGAVACMNGYRCDSDRGRLELTAGTGSSAGKIAHVQAKLAGGQICTATQNGGTAFFGIGSGGENTSGFDITSAVALTGKAVIDYSCH